MKQKLYIILYCSILLPLFLLVRTHAGAQTVSDKHIAYLKNETVPMTPSLTTWLDSLRPASGTEPVLTLVHFTTLPSTEERQKLAGEGITLLDYIPGNTFYAFVHPSFNGSGSASAAIGSITNVKSEWKADPYLWQTIKKEKNAVEVLVSFYPGIGQAAIKQFIATVGGQIHTSPLEPFGSFKVIIAANKVTGMASWYGVQCLSPVTEMFPLDLQSRPAVKGNVSATPASAGGYGLLGDGVTVGVGDNASGIYHADLKDRITNFNPGPLSHHGEHVNGIVGGAGNLDPLAEGMAPHVSLVDHLYDLVLPATGAMFHNYNMTITNNSYAVILGSCDYSGTYDGYSRFLDTLALQYPDVLHIFASGNDGYLSCSPYPAGFGTVSGGYQPAKNNVVVGSMTDFLYEASDESRGPVKDGRLKPEIIAVGLGAYSTIDVDQYEWAAGTSMASPQVAGGLAVLTQRLKQVNGGAQPRADLLKTVLLNGAMDLGNPGPDFSYGFGAMDIARSLKIIDNAWYDTGRVNNNDSQIISINVPANTGQLKVMLCWHDMPASPSAASQLVNDLDLTVTDPGAFVHHPLVPDPAPANVNIPATEHADHLNNVEQVTINNPAAGNYSVKIKGYAVPYPAQHYVVAYDFIPKGVTLTFPTGSEQLNNGDSVRIFWESAPDTASYTVRFSSDDGANWTILSSNVPATSRYFGWIPTGISSGKCLVRITKNGVGSASTSGRFAITNKPVMALDTAQCPGYVNVHWSPIAHASYYRLLSKTGFYMTVVDSTTDTTYSFSGMSLSKRSYVAVVPVVDGINGFRSVAVSTVANTGNCSKSVSNGDLAIEKVVGPQNGRMHTSSQLTSASVMALKVRNMYTSPCSSYSISYTVDGSLWQTVTPSTLIPTNGTTTVFIGGFDVSATGTYHFTAAIHNLSVTDPQTANDTVWFLVTNIPNDSLTLPFTEDFESFDIISLGHDSIGLSSNGHWDFQTGDSVGRMRSFVNEDITISGARSVSLDENQNVHNGSHNTFTGTFNLTGYDTATSEIRVDFDYVLHGTPKASDGNVVLARASDTAPWFPFFTYNLNAYPGMVNKARSLSLTDAVRGWFRNFSSSTQVSFGQNDTSLIAAASYGNGITIDNVKMYTVTNDVELVKVLSPLPTNCGLPSPQPLTVQVRNGVNYMLHNVQLFYKMDGGTLYTGIIDSISAKTTVNFTFSQQLTTPTGSTHSLDIWVNAPGDSYQPNDSLLNYKFRNNQIITAFPYLENFEAGDGGYYSDGTNNSWKYGTPASPKVNKAASGTHAWKTNLTGHYNNLELSYLYSPCFDISSMANPMLSFSASLDVENCGGTLCDQAYIEYSFNSVTWTKLGTSGQGTNWYDSTFNIWNTNGFSRWHVASIPLPQPPAGETIHFRFVLTSDPGANFEGFAVDDIHIFDLSHSIFPTGNISITKNLSGNTWQDYLPDSMLLASIQPQSQTMNNTEVALYRHSQPSNPSGTQYTFLRNYTVEAGHNPTDSIGIRLYLPESDVVAVVNDTTCLSCPRLVDAYSLGITQYVSTQNQSSENGQLEDDLDGYFNYYKYNTIKWVPYDNGYYAETKIKPLAELWFNDGGPTGTFPASVDYLNFIAARKGNDVQLNWRSLIDTAVSTYTLQRSTDSVHFTSIGTFTSAHLPVGYYSPVDTAVFPAAQIMYYRLKWSLTGKTAVYYSPVRKVEASDSASGLVTFTAHMSTHNSVAADWVSGIDGLVSQYILEREINNGGYKTINTTTSLRHTSQRYYYVDNITSAIERDAIVNYRLTLKMDDGTNIIPPIQTLLWEYPNTIGNVYPNPTTNDDFTIEWYADKGAIMDVNVTDITGRNIYKTSAQAGQYKNTTSVSTSRWPKGIYIIHSVIAGASGAWKVVVE